MSRGYHCTAADIMDGIVRETHCGDDTETSNIPQW